MSQIIDNQTIEGLLDTKSFRSQEVGTNISASTLTLTANSAMVQHFYGSGAGQIVKLPNATTLLVGHRFELWNISLSSVIAVNDGNNGNIATLGASSRVLLILRDNSSAAGLWMIAVQNNMTIDGAVATLTFSSSGGISQGKYLNIGQVISSAVGFPLNGSNFITKMTFSNGSVVAANKTGTFRLQRRTAQNTFVDISGTDLVITAGNYMASVAGLLVPVGPDWEISCYRINPDSGGATLADGVLNVFTVPQ